MNTLKIDKDKILSWIDDDLQKSIIPILEELETILNSSSWKDVLSVFNNRIEQLYKKQDIENLPNEVKDFIKTWYDEVWNRLVEILDLKK